MNTRTRYLQKIGKKGGLVSTEAKKVAARENGKKGGRPRKANVTVGQAGFILAPQRHVLDRG